MKKFTIGYSVLSGFFIGLATFFAKIAISYAGLLTLFITNPATWIAFVLALTGFLLLQKALQADMISRAIPIVTGLSIIIPVLLAVSFLGESIEGKYIAMVFVIAGVFLLSLSKKE